MKAKVPMAVLGGPEDGGKIHMALDKPESHDVQGSDFTFENGAKGYKIYHYLSDPRRRVLTYQGEEVCLRADVQRPEIETTEGGE